MRGEYFKWFSIFQKVGYWRKANAIHNWFVENVQNGEDDGGDYEVSKDDLEKLLANCQYVIKETKLVKGKVRNGQVLENGKWIDIYEDGKIIVDSSVAQEVLPTASGFFFGGTDYNEWYIETLTDTIEIIKEVLATTDFEKETISYYASW